MKNICKVILLLIICSFSSVYAQDNNSITPTYNGNIITLTVDEQGEAGEILTVTVVKKGMSKSVDNAFAIDEVAVDSNGVSTIVFEMPEIILDVNTQQEVGTDGEYILSVKDKNAITEYEFSFVTQTKRTEAIGILSTANGQQVNDMLVPESEYRAGLSAAGIDFAIYDNLSPEGKERVSTDFTSESNTAENSIDKITKIIAVTALNENSSPIETIMKSLNLVFEGEKYNDITATEKQSFVNGYMRNKKGQVTVQNVNSFYEKANVVFIFNGLRFNEFESKLDAYKNVLGISANEKYVSYLNATPAYRNKVGEEMVRILTQTPAAEISLVVSAFERACSVAGTNNQNNASGGGAGGGTGGGATGSQDKTSSATISVLQNNSYYDVFYDMKDAEWARNAVVSLHEKGIVSGVSENSFMPNKNVTREEFVTMLVKAKNLKQVTVNVFDDVQEDAWYAPYVGAAYEAGFVNGTSENSFGIGSLLTRQDMFAMIYRIIGQTGEKTRSIEEIQDFEKTSDYAKEAVKNLYESGCVSGTGESKIEPLAYTTRAQAAVMIYRLFAQGGTV